MKVILEAFGMLRSEVQDWPEESPPDIRLRLGLPRFDIGAFGKPEELAKLPLIDKIGVFQWNGMAQPIGGGKTAKIYVLVNI